MTSIIFSIIFDLDGVLLDSETDLSWMKKAIEDTIHSLNRKPTDDILNMLSHKNISNFPDVAEKLEIDVQKLWKKRNMFYTKRKIEAILSNQIQPFDDVSALRQLKQNSELGILSNSPQEVVDIFINHFHFDDLFTAAIGRTDKYEDIFKLKPHPLLWQKIRPLITGKNNIYVGDRLSDEIFAKKMDMKFFGLNRYQHHFEYGYSSLYDVVKDIQKLILKK